MSRLKFTSLVILSLVIWSLPHAAFSQQGILREPQPDTGYRQAAEQAGFIIDTLMKAQQVPGMQAAVSVKGKKVWSEGFGFADLEHKTPVWPQTKMRIGSVSKTITSVAVGKLMNEGKLDLDAPVQQYVPYFPEKKYSVTTRQVAGHIAGIRHYTGYEPASAEFLSAAAYKNVEESLNIFKDDTLMFKPGEDYLYSTYGWNLISAVVEGAAGEDYLEYMQKNVFDPLLMTGTVPDKVKPVIAHRTSFYEKNEQGLIVNAPFVDNSNKWAGGGFLGTAEDLLKFGNAMLQGALLGRETVDLLWEPMQTSDGKTTHYGIGWMEGTSDSGVHWVGHSGGSVGGTTQFIIYPEYEVVVALTSNMSGVRYNKIHFLIADLFSGR